MPERVYVSDTDLQTASDIEIIRISRRFVADVNSSFPGRRKKIIGRIREHAYSNPMSTIPFLLRYFDHVDPNIRDNSRALVEELTASPTGELALLESIFSFHSTVGDSAAALLESRNLSGTKFRELYLNSEALFNSCKIAGVYTSDVKELLIKSVNLYRNKLVEQAFEDIILVNDILKDRLDWTQNTRKYIQDVLKLTPQLSRSGVSVDNIHESLKILTEALKTRDYKETKDLVELKKLEASVDSQMESVLSYISKKLKSDSIDLVSYVSLEDQWIFDSMKKLGEEVKSYLKKKKRFEALQSIYSFVSQELAGKYLESAMSKIESGEKNSQLTAGQIIVGITKIFSMAMPNAASELFDAHLKDKVRKNSIEKTPWPPTLKSLSS